MPVAAVAAVVGAVATVAGTVLSHVQQKKANKNAKKAARFQRQQAELQARREKIAAINEGRMANARAAQAAENQGVASSSGAQGGQGSIISQMGSNLSFLDQYGYLSELAGNQLQKAADHNAQASMWQGVASIGSQIYSMSGGFKKK